MEEKKYIWKDIVLVNGKVTSEEFEISGEMADSASYYIDDFLEAVAAKYGVKPDEVKTYMHDGIEFDPASEDIKFGEEDCGCYIDSVAEWLL